jgi:acetyl esterase/lipase
MMRKLFLFLLIIMIASAQIFAQENSSADTTIKPVETPAGFTKQLNVVYTSGKGWNEKMDIYLPPNSGKPTPVIINVHGGGWNHGTKESQTGFNSFF